VKNVPVVPEVLDKGHQRDRAAARRKRRTACSYSLPDLTAPNRCPIRGTGWSRHPWHEDQRR
jgi:hypothetical protein